MIAVWKAERKASSTFGENLALAGLDRSLDPELRQEELNLELYNRRGEMRGILGSVFSSLTGP
jgi:hypothetical protein